MVSKTRNDRCTIPRGNCWRPDLGCMAPRSHIQVLSLRFLPVLHPLLNALRHWALFLRRGRHRRSALAPTENNILMKGTWLLMSPLPSPKRKMAKSGPDDILDQKRREFKTESSNSRCKTHRGKAAINPATQTSIWARLPLAELELPCIWLQATL